MTPLQIILGTVLLIALYGVVVFVFVRLNYIKSSLLIVAIPLLVLFSCVSILNAVSCINEYHDQIRIRDAGISTTGIVINLDTTTDRSSPDYHVDYVYSPRDEKGVVHRNIKSANHEILPDVASKFPVGSRIPIKYDPDKILDTHLDVEGHWSDARLQISGILNFIFGELAIGLPLGFCWLFALLIYRRFNGHDAGATLPSR